MRFNHYSDTWLISVYGDSELWLYDVATTDGPVLLGVSASTGRVVQSVRMPALYRPAVAVDDDGVFFGAREAVDADEAVYRVSPFSSRAVRVHSGVGQVLYLTGSGHRLDATFIGPRDRITSAVLATATRS